MLPRSARAGLSYYTAATHVGEPISHVGAASGYGARDNPDGHAQDLGAQVGREGDKIEMDIYLDRMIVGDELQMTTDRYSSPFVSSA